MKTTYKPLVSPLIQRQQVRRPLAVQCRPPVVVGSMSISVPALRKALRRCCNGDPSRESVQDIPMSVSVMGEAQLTDLNVTDMEDYLMMLPNVGFISTGYTANIYIRGISSGGESYLSQPGGCGLFGRAARDAGWRLPQPAYLRYQPN